MWYILFFFFFFFLRDFIFKKTVFVNNWDLVLCAERTQEEVQWARAAPEGVRQTAGGEQDGQESVGGEGHAHSGKQHH